MADTSRPFRAKYDGDCAVCPNRIKVGHLVRLKVRDGKKLLYHADCRRPNGRGYSEALAVHQNSQKPSNWRRKVRRK